jgi:hypothetical protein
MAATVEIRLAGGVADGQTVTVELDSNGRPPLTHHHLRGRGLTGAEIYELESVGDHEERWLYRWRGPAT